MIRQAMVLVASVLAATCGQAQGLDDADRTRIDHSVEQMLERTQTPSASIAVIKDGRIAYVHAYGLARLEPPLAATPATRYQVASLSKEIVAAAALLLQQDGKLSLDDKVAKWLPDLTDARDITLRQCLTHTAGYPDFWPQDYLMAPMRQPTTTQRILEGWAKRPLSFSPGSSWQYSNTGYVVAGRIVELASGEPLFEFVHDRIFEPLGINDALDVSQSPLGVPDALGYIRAALGPPRLQPPAGAGWLFAAAQFALTAEDLAKWDLSILHQTLLSAVSYQAEFTTARQLDGKDTGYALGLVIDTRGGRRIISHTGEGAGYLSVNRIYPDDQAAVVILTNTFSGRGLIEAADAVEFILLPPLGVDARVRAVFDGLQHGRPDRAMFTANLSDYLDARTTEDYARTLGPLGPPTAFAQRSTEDRGGMKFYDYRVVAGGQHLELSVYVTADGKFEQFLIAATPQ